PSLAGKGQRVRCSPSARKVISMPDEVICTREGAIATITLNRPEKRNAINQPMLNELSATIARLEAERQARVVVIHGAGVAFCSGLDLRDRESRVSGSGPDSVVTPVFRQIERSHLVSIAAVNGDAIAGGCELAMHCDLRIASER